MGRRLFWLSQGFLKATLAPHRPGWRKSAVPLYGVKARRHRGHGSPSYDRRGQPVIPAFLSQVPGVGVHRPCFLASSLPMWHHESSTELGPGEVPWRTITYSFNHQFPYVCCVPGIWNGHREFPSKEGSQKHSVSHGLAASKGKVMFRPTSTH